MTAGSSRFLLKFLECLLTSGGATDVMNISDMRGETGGDTTARRCVGGSAAGGSSEQGGAPAAA